MRTTTELVHRALDGFRIELPSWGFANTGTRFGKFLQPAAAAHARGEVRRRRAGARADRRLPDGRAARAVGSARRRRQTSAQIAAAGRRGPASGPGRSTRTSSRISATSTDRSGNPDADGPRRPRCDHVLDSVAIARALGSRDVSLLVRRRLELSRHREHPPAQALVRAKGCRPAARALAPEPAAARRVQAVRAGVLPHRHRRLGHGAAARARRRAAGARCSSTPAITTRRRTSSRSSRGCSTRRCSAASTSTTAGMPTTT